MNVAKLTNFSRKIQFFAARGPAYYYSYGQWQLGRWLNKISARSYDLADAALVAGLDLNRPGLAAIKALADQDQTAQALTQLAAYFQTRTNPAFYFEASHKPDLLAGVPADTKQATLAAADKICQHIFEFRQAEPVKFEKQIDWTYRPQGNIDWTWDLNRHAYFETLGRAYHYSGDERYARKFGEILLDWLTHNPAGEQHPNWFSVFEVAFRVNLWIWAFYYFREAAAFDQQLCLGLLKGLLIHGRYLDANIELHVPNNHLLLEAKALALLGLLFPEFKEAKRWQQRGERLFYQEIRAQVRPDGVHGEQSTHYHRVIAGELLEWLVLLQNNGLTIPADIAETFGRMVEFELWITKPNGLIPLLSDSALADTHLRFSATSAGPVFLERPDLKMVAPSPGEAEMWLLGAHRVKEAKALSARPGQFDSRSFPDGGYVVMRSGAGESAAYLVFDCGPFGYKPLPNHGHADALSLELHACGQTLLVDPGVYSTALGETWRNFFRGTRAHNTVVVDEQDQSILMDTRRVYRPAQATLQQWLSDPEFDYVEGWHNGYERLPQPVTHHRQIFFAKPDYWVVIDTLTGQGRHVFDLYFHLMPGVETSLDALSKTLRASKTAEPGLIIAPVAPAQWQAEVLNEASKPIQGWVSFFSGQKQPAPVLRYRQENSAPVQFVTVLYPYPAGQPASVTVSPLSVQLEGSALSSQLDVTGLCIETGHYQDYLLLDRVNSGAVKKFGDYQTDAQVVYLRRDKETGWLVKSVSRGGHHLFFQGQPLSAAETAPTFQVS